MRIGFCTWNGRDAPMLQACQVAHASACTSDVVSLRGHDPTCTHRRGACTWYALSRTAAIRVVSPSEHVPTTYDHTRPMVSRRHHIVHSGPSDTRAPPRPRVPYPLGARAVWRVCVSARCAASNCRAMVAVHERSRALVRRAKSRRASNTPHAATHQHWYHALPCNTRRVPLRHPRIPIAPRATGVSLNQGIPPRRRRAPLRQRSRPCSGHKHNRVAPSPLATC